MKRILVTVFGLLCAASLTVLAQDAKPKKEGKAKHQMTEEQKTLYKSMVEKYDADKNGKLDKEERAKISKEDKEKMKEAGLFGNKEQGDKENGKKEHGKKKNK